MINTNDGKDMVERVEECSPPKKPSIKYSEVHFRPQEHPNQPSTISLEQKGGKVIAGSKDVLAKLRF